MLEVQSFKNLFDAIGKLAPWIEEAGQASAPSGPPPQELVKQFEAALESVNKSEQVQPMDAAKIQETYPSPNDLIQKSELFNGADGQVKVDTEQKLDLSTNRVDQTNNIQNANLDRGLDALGENIDTNFDPDKAREAAKELLTFLQKDASQISPQELLRAQQIVGILKVGGESGTKVSEGISETFEQLLDNQG